MCFLQIAFDAETYLTCLFLCRWRIFDFDDWNDHAVANYRPYLISDSFDASISASWHINREIDLDNLGGRIVDSLSLHARSEPYVIRSDITVMPEATLHIYPDVVMEFAPNVGILVLGTLKAVGVPGHEIVMRPMKRMDANANSTFSKLTQTRTSANLMSMPDQTIRLCKDGRCSPLYNEGRPKNKKLIISKRNLSYINIFYFFCLTASI